MFWKRPNDTVDDTPAANLPAVPAQPPLTPAQRMRQAEADLRIRELEELAAFEARKRAAEREDWERTRAAEKKATKSTRSRVAWRKLAGTAVPYLPLILTNIMAIMGQTGWGREHLSQIGATADSPARWTVALLFAGTLESLALFQGFYANKALERGDSAAGLYAGAFGTAAVVAALNYSHYADDAAPAFTVGPIDVPAPTAMAVVFAMFSFISPALWRIHSRAVNRDKLKSRGEIDTRGVKLSMTRRVWHPIKSLGVQRRSAWTGITDPSEAVADWERAREEEREAKARAKQEKPQKVSKPKGQHRAPEVEAAAGDPELPEVAQRFPEAWDALVTAWRAGNTLSQRALANDHLNGNRHHARALLVALKDWEERGAA